jgi:hypothetical protein
MRVEPQYLNALRIIYAALKDRHVNWVVTGSLGMALQGMDVDIHDLDIQTEKTGAYEIERCLSKYVVTPVRYAESDRIRSHLGRLAIDGVRVEIMGDIQKRVDDAWEEPVDIKRHKRWLCVQDIDIPVLSLEYEYWAYLRLGRMEKAEMLRTWLQC